MHPDERLHLRALRMLDELQRIGFEQLRFCRSGEGQHVRLQIYPASQSKSDLGIQWELDQQFTLSDSTLYLWGLDRDDSARQRKWQALLCWPGIWLPSIWPGSGSWISWTLPAWPTALTTNTGNGSGRCAHCSSRGTYPSPGGKTLTAQSRTTSSMS